jgi:hypothetical protein
VLEKRYLLPKTDRWHIWIESLCLCLFVHFCKLKYLTDFEGIFAAGQLIYPEVPRNALHPAIMTGGYKNCIEKERNLFYSWLGFLIILWF